MSMYNRISVAYDDKEIPLCWFQNYSPLEDWIKWNGTQVKYKKDEEDEDEYTNKYELSIYALANLKHELQTIVDFLNKRWTREEQAYYDEYGYKKSIPILSDFNPQENSCSFSTGKLHKLYHTVSTCLYYLDDNEFDCQAKVYAYTEY